jgi:DNA-binding protein HU-beta
VNKQELVGAVGDRLGDRRTAAAAVEAVLDAVTAALADGQRVALFGFGVFERVDRPARTARNPATGGTVEVPATAVPRFRPGVTLKKAVAGSSGALDASQRDAEVAPKAASDDERPVRTTPEPTPRQRRAAAGTTTRTGGAAKDGSKAKAKAERKSKGGKQKDKGSRKDKGGKSR